MQDLKAWRKSKGLTQSELADKIPTNQKSYSAYETGRTEIPHDTQARLRKMGFDGPWPHESATKATSDTITREDFAHALGRLEGRLETYENRLETAFELLRDLKLSISRIEERLK